MRRMIAQGIVYVGMITILVAQGGAQTPQTPRAAVPTPAPQTAPAPRAVVDGNGFVMTALVRVRLGNSPTDMDGPVSSGIVKYTRGGAVERMEFSPNPNAGQWDMGQAVPLGTIFLTTVADTMVSVTALDTMQKTYTVLNVHDAPTYPPGMPKPPAEQMPVTRVSGIAVTVDSLGPGPVILGHPTMRYRQTQRATIQTDMGKMMTIIVRTESAADLEIATDIPNAPRIHGFGLERLVHGLEGFGIASDLEPAMQAAQAKYPHGVVLHVSGYQNTPQGTRIVTVDVDKLESTHVDPTILVPPAGYTKGFFGGAAGMGMPFR